MPGDDKVARVPRYSAVLFDLDGTLIDSTGLIVDNFHHTLAAFGLPRQSDAAWLATVGTPLRVALAPWARDAAMLEAMLAAYREHNLAKHDACVRAFPGVVPTVRALLRAEVRLAVVTSKSRAGTMRGLRAAGLDRDFDALVCIDDVTNGKPHREPVDRALALLGVSADAALFVGDSLHDMHAGRAADVATGAALWGPFRRAHLEPSEPSHWFDSPCAVVDLVLARGGTSDVGS
jgi:pyrophosphatase PpaX